VKLDKQVETWLAACAVLAIAALVSDDDVSRSSGTDELTAALDSKLDGLSAAKRCKALRVALKRYEVMGLGKTLTLGPYVSEKADSITGKEGSAENAAYLQRLLVAAWAGIQRDRLVLNGEPVMPELYRKLPSLGGKTPQRIASEAASKRSKPEMLAAGAVVSAAVLLRRAAKKAARTAARRERAARGAACTRALGGGSGGGGPPAITNALVGYRLDVCFDLGYKSKGGGAWVKKLSWCPGTVTSIQRAVLEGSAGIALVVTFDDKDKILVSPRSAYWNQPVSGGWRACVEDDEVESGDEDLTDGEFDSEDVSDDEMEESDDEAESAE
jgi:hypothetical protein